MQSLGRDKAWDSLAAYLCAAKALGEEVRDKICKFSGAAEQQYQHKSSHRGVGTVGLFLQSKGGRELENMAKHTSVLCRRKEWVLLYL